MEKYRRKTEVFIYYVLPILLLVAMISMPGRWLLAKYGNAAFLLLAGNLFLKPISVLFKHPYFSYLSTYRREIGIASFWLYFFHAAGMYKLFALNPGDFFDPQTFLFWAGLASPIMWILALTSNDKAVRLLKRNWKRIHRFAYLLFFYALIHSSMVEGETERILIIGAPFLMLKFFEYKKIPFRW